MSDLVIGWPSLATPEGRAEADAADAEMDLARALAILGARGGETVRATIIDVPGVKCVESVRATPERVAWALGLVMARHGVIV